MQKFYPLIFKKAAFLLCLFALLFAQLQAQDIELANFDKNVKPGEDFFKFVNGMWLKKAEIPPSESRWGSFNELIERNRMVLKEILEDAAKNSGADRGSNLQLTGDLYASGMNQELRNQLGIKPIQSELDAINQIKNVDDIVKTIARHRTLSISSVFGFGVNADAKNSKMNAIYLNQSGTSLPDRSYYMENTERFEKIRKEYLGHIAKMFELAGENPDNAKKFAQTILKIETRLAEAQRSRTDLRNPQKRYNKMTLENLSQMTYNIDWNKYFENLGVKNVESVIVGQPEFLAIVDRMIRDVALDDWKTYFKWKLLRDASNSLSSAFEEENFRFNGMILNGLKEIQAQWKRIQQVVDGSLREPLGQLYVARAYPPKAKAKMSEMIENIREAFAERIKNLEWMSTETKEQALKKLATIIYKIGYPEKWRDYSGLEIKRDDYLGNLRRINDFEFKRTLDKIGQPVDRTEFGMSAPTVNAYYNPLVNEIVFPAGILQPPFFDFKADDAVNYGAIGAVIGHEITHGFDDQGSQYDAEGNLKMWWTKEDRAKFEERANQLVAQYNAYKVVDTVSINGRLTLGENIADLGGLTIAFDALQRSFKKNGRPKNKDGFTPEQRFFIGFARVWRGKYRDEALLQRIKTDPHSPSEFRANGTVSNMTSFYEAYQIKEGEKMRNKNRVVIW